MERELWICTQILNLAPIQIAYKLGVSVKTIRNWIHKPPVRSPYYSLLRQLIREKVANMPSSTVYEREWRDTVDEFISQLLTRAPNSTSVK